MRNPAIDLPLEIERRGGPPIYIQVKRGLEKLVASGQLRKGQRLPTERALAQKLGVSRNTVSLAYRQLEAEGLITSRQGKGTFVTEADDIVRIENRRERLKRIIDSSIEEAISLGISLDEYLEMAAKRAGEKKEILARLRVVFIECNREQLDYFSKELQLDTGVSVVPLMIDDLRAGGERVTEIIAGADLIVTTFFHLDEVKSLLSSRSEDIVGIALDPVLESIVRIARLPKGARVALVCISEAFGERVLKSVENAGIDGLDITLVTSRDPDEVRASLRGKRACIVSPGRLKEVQALAGRGTEVIEFIYKPDAGSVNFLRSLVLERKNRNRTGVGMVGRKNTSLGRED